MKTYETKSFKLLLTMALVALLLSGCVTGEYATRRGVQGGGLGALIGFAASGGKGMGAALGAASGGALGLVVGIVEDEVRKPGAGETITSATPSMGTAPRFSSWAEYTAFMRGRAEAQRRAREAAIDAAYERGLSQ